MKKILMLALFSSVTTLAMANPIGIGYSTTNPNATTNLTQCVQMDEAKENMLSQINMEKQICLYENYAKLTDRWSVSPPEPYLPPHSIIINMNKEDVTPAMKEKLATTSEQCKEVAGKMRVKLKDLYSVDNFVCR